jgi:hypothetical protein
MTLSNGELNQTWAVSIIEPIQHELEDNFGLEPNASPLLLAPATTTSTTKARSWHSTTQVGVIRPVDAAILMLLNRLLSGSLGYCH